MSNRAALIALILAYWTCRALAAASIFGTLTFLAVYVATGQPQFGYAAVVCIGSMVGFVIAGAVAQNWARA